MKEVLVHQQREGGRRRVLTRGPFGDLLDKGEFFRSPAGCEGLKVPAELVPDQGDPVDALLVGRLDNGPKDGERVRRGSGLAERQLAEALFGSGTQGGDGVFLGAFQDDGGTARTGR